MTNTKRKARPFYAFCWRTGRIGFGRSVPDGAMQLASGTARVLRDRVAARARHAYDGKTLLVPGVPEALNEDLALKAVRAFVARLKPGWKSPAGRRWTWICEFCYGTSLRPFLPRGWEFVWQSAICAKCQPKIEAFGGIAVCPGGEFANGRPDPRMESEVAA